MVNSEALLQKSILHYLNADEDDGHCKPHVNVATSFR